MRSGAFSHLLNDPANPHRHASDRRSSSRNHAHRHNVDETMADAGHLRSSSTGSETFTTFSGAFGSLFDGHHQITSGGSHTPGFFIPSYLRGSRYAQSVQRQYRSRIVAPREDPVRAPRSPQPGTSLSTDSHETKAPAKGGSHRGMAYEVVEKAPVAMEESLPPLPTRWSSTDKHIGVEVVSDGLEIKFVGGKNISERDHEASAVRADHGIPTQCGLYYYEMTVSEKRRDEYAHILLHSSSFLINPFLGSP